MLTHKGGNMADRQIRREIAQIAVPVSLEMVFQLALGVIDQLIVGILGAVAIAAVGFANHIIAIGSLTLAMLGTGAAILVAQAQGSGQTQRIAPILSTALIFGVALSFCLSLPLAILARPFLAGLGAEPDIIGAGQTYFQIVVLTLPLTVINAIVSAALRALGQARAPMTITMIAVILNTLIGYILVFGLGPSPALGVAGAAWATFAAQGGKAVLLLERLYGRRSQIHWELPSSLAEWHGLSKALLHLSLPLTAKEIFWSGGTFLYTLLFAQIGAAVLAASQIVATLEAVFIVASLGLMTAATILVGQAAGGADMALAQVRTRALLQTGTLTGLICGALYLSTALLLPIFYPQVELGVIHIAFWGIVINAAIHLVKVRNMIQVGIMLGSGDARGAVIGDVAGAFALGLPLAYLLGFTAGFGVWGIFLARTIEEIIKTIFFGWRVSRLPYGRFTAGQNIVYNHPPPTS
jgi:putative MATE family efflux protein